MDEITGQLLARSKRYYISVCDLRHRETKMIILGSSRPVCLSWSSKYISIWDNTDTSSATRIKVYEKMLFRCVSSQGSKILRI